MAAHMLLLEQNPAFRVNQMRLEGATERRRAVATLKKPKLVTIKTVVNVVYKTNAQNVSTAQINSQIAVLNRDFRAKNPDRAGTPTPWKGLVGDTFIQFKLAKVTRTKTSKDAFSFDEGVKKASTGGIAPYSPKTHLNLWVCALSGGLLGYAQFPGGPRPTDGVVINISRSARPALRKRRSIKAAPRRTKSGITSICATSGATRPTAAAATWLPTHRIAPGPNFGDAPGRW